MLQLKDRTLLKSPWFGLQRLSELTAKADTKKARIVTTSFVWNI